MGKYTRRFYLPTRLKFFISLFASTLWAAFSVWMARFWADDLGSLITKPLAWVIIFFIAIIPGFLNMNLTISILLDWPPPLIFRKKLPKITVLIAAYNEGDSLPETIRGLRNQKYPGKFEVIIVDDGSTDKTAEIAKELTKYMEGFTLLVANHSGKANALNLGIKHVKTPFVVTIDADTFLHPEALARIITRFLQSPPNTAAVAGTVLAKNSSQNFLTRMQEWDYFCAIASVKRQQSLFQGTLVAQGAFSAFRTELIREVSWPDVLGEDIVATWALLKKGYNITFEPTAVGFTMVPAQFSRFRRQRERWARGMIEGLKRHGDILLKRPSIPAFFVFIDYLFPLLDGFTSIVLIPGIILAIFGKFWIVGPYTLFVLPITFFTISIMLAKQKKVFDVLGLKIRRNLFGFFFYVLIYQFIMSPISFFGYLKEFFKIRKKW
ncbi:MAG: glycosyltransferase [Actinobacteria bacterium]|nr:glycosyltransferase [Actinomycetota bacterium]